MSEWILIKNEIKTSSGARLIALYAMIEFAQQHGFEVDQVAEDDRGDYYTLTGLSPDQQYFVCAYSKG